MKHLRFLLLALSTLFLVSLVRVRSAPLTRHVERQLGPSSTKSVTTVDGRGTEEEEDEDRAPIIPAKGEPSGGEQASALGPWAIAGIVVAAIGALVVAAVAGVAIDRRRKRSRRGNELNDDLERRYKRRTTKFVPPDDDSWRGPPVFEEILELPNQDGKGYAKRSGEVDDELTILEPLLLKTK